MNKKILLAVAAMAFGFSLNVSAHWDSDDVCRGVCQGAHYFCHLSYDETKCDFYRNQCDVCVASL